VYNSLYFVCKYPHKNIRYMSLSCMFKCVYMVWYDYLSLNVFVCNVRKTNEESLSRCTKSQCNAFPSSSTSANYQISSSIMKETWLQKWTNIMCNSWVVEIPQMFLRMLSFYRKAFHLTSVGNVQAIAIWLSEFVHLCEWLSLQKGHVTCAHKHAQLTSE